MRRQRVVVIGAGVGGLVAALLLAARGVDVTVLERADAPAGQDPRGRGGRGAASTRGPTVFTMRWVFEQISTRRAPRSPIICASFARKPSLRHIWREGEHLDLFADPAQSADAIEGFAGRDEAEGFRRFCARSRSIYETLRDSFILAERPSPVDLLRHAGLGGLPDLLRISPFASMWTELGTYFRDARLRQLFGRYATYCGSSPYAAPATLMLVAHVEMDGVWRLAGGMHSLALALTQLAKARGATFRFGTDVETIIVEAGRVAGVSLASGERIEAEAIVMNGDVAALRSGLLGPGRNPPSARRRARSPRFRR